MADSRTRLFDRQTLALILLIFLTETAITVLFSLFQQYPARLLAGEGNDQALLLRRSTAYAGYALSAYGTAKLPGQPLCGWLADRFGPRRVLILGLLASLVVVLLMAWSPVVLLLVVTAGLYGLAVAVIWPAVYALVGESHAASDRGRILAAISAAQLAGTAGGFAAGAFAIDYGSFGLGFGLTLALDGVALLVALSLSRARKPAGAIVAESSAMSPTQTGEPRQIHSWRSLISLNLLLLSSILGLISVAVALLVPDLKAYSSSILHLRYSTFTLLLAIPAGVGVLTLLPSGTITDRLGRSLPMLVAVILWPIGILALTFTNSVPLVVLFASLAAFAYALGLPAWSASLIDISSPGSLGLQVGVASSVQAIGLALGPAIGGQTVLHLGTLAPFRLSAGLMILTAAITVAYRSRTRHLYPLPRDRQVLHPLQD
ncbi:MAG: MFS transporter [Dehalococcoidia bacterium]